MTVFDYFFWQKRQQRCAQLYEKQSSNTGSIFLYNAAFIFMPSLQKEGNNVLIFLHSFMPLPTVGMCCTSIEMLQVTEKSYGKHDGKHCNKVGGWEGDWQPTDLLRKTWPCCHLQPLQGCKHITISSKGPLSSTRQPLSLESASDGPLKALVEILIRKI